jgi:putative hydrolase of the HAD superfamily
VTRVEAVITDFGGVLTLPLMDAFRRIQDEIDIPLEAYPRAFAYSLEHDGVHPLFALERGELPEPAFLARMERGMEHELGRPVSLHGFHERLMNALETNVEILDYYRGLRSRGIRLAICTNNVREWEAQWRSKLPIDELFEFVVDSAFVGTRKPEPEIYAIVLERIGLPPPACVFVDDVDVNVAAARAAGMHAVQFVDTAQTIADLERLLGT